MEGTGNNLVLLLLRQLDKVNSVTGNTDGQLGILLRMCLSVQQGLLGEDVDIQMVAALLNVAVQQGNQIVDLLFSCFHNNFLL